jgi:hypothetical protein
VIWRCWPGEVWGKKLTPWQIFVELVNKNATKLKKSNLFGIYDNFNGHPPKIKKKTPQLIHFEAFVHHELEKLSF